MITYKEMNIQKLHIMKGAAKIPLDVPRLSTHVTRCKVSRGMDVSAAGRTSWRCPGADDANGRADGNCGFGVSSIAQRRQRCYEEGVGRSSGGAGPQRDCRADANSWANS